MKLILVILFCSLLFILVKSDSEPSNDKVNEETDRGFRPNQRQSSPAPTTTSSTPKTRPSKPGRPSRRTTTITPAATEPSSPPSSTNKPKKTKKPHNKPGKKPSSPKPEHKRNRRQNRPGAKHVKKQITENDLDQLILKDSPQLTKENLSDFI